jgi:mRNA interferase MazF
MPSTTNFQAGDLILVDFPFAGGKQVKTRPALVILDSGDADLVVARVTTQSVSAYYDVPITDWQGAGLLAPSSVRLHELATLEKSLIRRVLGSLQQADRNQVSAKLKQACGSW